MVDWRPGASLDTLKNRAELLARLRAFFAEKGVLEVETPVLASAPVSDLHIQSFSTESTEPARKLYLQTSPEFAMKRLLAAHGEPIYQVSRVFRRDPATPRHNPEFSLLEWYRPGFSLAQLMAEVAELMESLLDCGVIPVFSYRELFETHLHCNPHRIASAELASLARDKTGIGAGELSDTDYLQLLMNAVVEPRLPELCFVRDYPEQQASLAAVETDAEGDRVARRFELYCRGMELANGYHELTDAAEQRRRFEADNAARKARGLEAVPIDEKLLAALEAGLPACSGVALGLDRLLMVRHGIDRIDQAISFSTPRA